MSETFYVLLGRIHHLLFTKKKKKKKKKGTGFFFNKFRFATTWIEAPYHEIERSAL